MASLLELTTSIRKNGRMETNEILQLEQLLLADSKIDKEEANLLFELNDFHSNTTSDRFWEKLFINAISSYLLDDQNTPGTIDENEAIWLLEKVNKDGKLDELEIKLLRKLRDELESMPDNLSSFITQNI